MQLESVGFVDAKPCVGTVSVNADKDLRNISKAVVDQKVVGRGDNVLLVHHKTCPG
ncbi:MAG: hypothetical protein Rhob2KO_29330 [Rhodopirellula baltica]